MGVRLGKVLHVWAVGLLQRKLRSPENSHIGQVSLCQTPSSRLSERGRRGGNVLSNAGLFAFKAVKLISKVTIKFHNFPIGCFFFLSDLCLSE